MGDEGLCASWLWAHDRWRNQDIPSARLRLEAKRDLTGADMRARGLARMPRKTRFWVRLPNWLGDVAMAVPLLRAIHESRPDAEITLLAQPGFVPLLESWGLADRVRPLPGRGPGYFGHFAGLRTEYPDAWILLTNSASGRPGGADRGLPPAVRHPPAGQVPAAAEPHLPPAEGI